MNEMSSDTGDWKLSTFSTDNNLCDFLFFAFVHYTPKSVLKSALLLTGTICCQGEQTIPIQS